MNERIDLLLSQIRLMEREVLLETRRSEQTFGYEFRDEKVRFTEEAKVRQKEFRVSIHRYLLDSRFLVVLTAPVIWSCLLPVVLVDLIGSIYQTICFPVYGIPRVRRGDYLAFDRHRLTYLNFIEKLNCAYCAYANGIIAYFTEIVARTEQHWCPIKHANCLKCAHSRYKKFFAFGDAESYRMHVEETRREYRDISPSPLETKTAIGNKPPG